jgi:hypothetical protein
MREREELVQNKRISLTPPPTQWQQSITIVFDIKFLSLLIARCRGRWWYIEEHIKIDERFSSMMMFIRVLMN